MLKLGIFGLIFLSFLTHVQGRESKLLFPSNVLDVVSFSTNNPLDNFTYRASVNYDGGEGWVFLGVEKYKEGEIGNPLLVKLTAKIAVPNIDGFKSFADKMAQKSMERSFGCCRPTDLKWSKDASLSFKIKYKDRIFNEKKQMMNGKKVTLTSYSHTEVSLFSCNTASLIASTDMKLKCKRTSFKKINDQ